MSSPLSSNSILLGTSLLTASGGNLYLDGSAISGASGAGGGGSGLTTGQADARYLSINSGALIDALNSWTGISTNLYYPLSSNPSGYITGFNSGLFVLDSETGIFATSANLSSTGQTLLDLISAASAGVSSLNGSSGVITLGGQTGIQISTVGQNISFSTTGVVYSSESGQFYASSNPSQFITSGNVSTISGDLSTRLINTGSTLNTQINSLSGFTTGISGVLNTKIAAITGVSGQWVQTGQTGVFATASNLGLTGSNLSSLITTLNSWTGASSGIYYPRTSNPSSYISSGNAISLITNRTVYVSASGGNDTNLGTYNSPFATLARAASALSGNGEIFLLEGDYFRQSLDYSTYPNITLSAEHNKFANIFMGFTATGFTLFTGTTWVSNQQYTNLPSGVGQNKNYILESGTKQFLIDISDVHPLQRAKSYRLDHAIVSGVASGNILSTSGVTGGIGRWADSGGYIYVNSPSGTSNGKTYLYPQTNASGCLFYSFTTPPINAKVKMNNIRVYNGYNCVDFSNLAEYEVTNCSFIGAFNEGLSATNIGFGTERYCEYAACNNDGMGAQSSTLGRQRSKFEIYEAWAHDNGDEGHNGHNNCEVVYYGGLFEYNTFAGGITSALGCKTTVYNAHTRRNALGMTTAVDENTDNGNGTQLIAYNCISERDGYGYYAEISSGQAWSKLYNHTFISPVSAGVCTISSGVTTTLFNPRFVNTPTRANALAGGTIIITGDNSDSWDTSFKKLTYTAQTTGVNNTSIIGLFDYQGSGNYADEGWIHMNYNAPTVGYNYTPIKMIASRVSPALSVEGSLQMTTSSLAMQISCNYNMRYFAGNGYYHLFYVNNSLKFYLQNNGNFIMPAATPPATASSAGTAGEVSIGTSNGTGFLYVATGTNAWGRAALLPW